MSERDPTDAAWYDEELASEWKHVQQYADAKTAIVHEILARAEAG